MTGRTRTTGRPRRVAVATLASVAIVAGLVTSLATHASAAEIALRASEATVTVGRQFTIEAEVRGGGMSSPGEPALLPVEGVRQVSSYRSQNFSFVNGRATSSVLVQYVMVADGEGTYTFGPATVPADGGTLASDTVTVEVLAAGSSAAIPRKFGEDDDASAAGDRDLIVLGSVDNVNPYVNEQIVYTFTFLRRVDLMEGGRYTPPSTTGFWLEELDRTDPTEVVIDGRRYTAERIRSALFPTGDGTYTIGPARLSVTIAEVSNRRRRDPFDLLGNDPFGLLRRGRPVSLQTDPVTVEVKPLPSEGKPRGFSGAVGTFTLTSNVDRREVRAGEPITLSVTLKGQGNVKGAPAPDLSVLSDFKVYESKSEESSSVAGDRVVGTRAWEFVLVPVSGGDVVIPPVRVSTFDPVRGEYQTLESEPIALQVEASDLDEALARGDDPSVAKERVRLRQRDIRYLKPAPASLRSDASPFTRSGVLLAHVVPALAFAGSALFRRHRDRLRTDERYARHRRAGRVATKRLKASNEALASGELEAFFARLSDALRGYVADKLHLSAVNLDEATVRSGLSALGVATPENDELLAMLEHCDSARFSPLGTDARAAADLARRAEEWISKVERR